MGDEISSRVAVAFMASVLTSQDRHAYAWHGTLEKSEGLCSVRNDEMDRCKSCLISIHHKGLFSSLLAILHVCLDRRFWLALIYY